MINQIASQCRKMTCIAVAQSSYFYFKLSTVADKQMSWFWSERDAIERKNVLRRRVAQKPDLGASIWWPIKIPARSLPGAFSSQFTMHAHTYNPREDFAIAKSMYFSLAHK